MNLHVTVVLFAFPLSSRCFRPISVGSRIPARPSM